MRTKRFLSIVIAATMLISLVAMNAGAEKVLKVGLMGPFTGPAAQSGASIKNSLLMRLDEAGNKVGDYKLEIMFIDTQSDPAKATNAYVEAIERKGMQVGMGGWHSSVAMAVVDQAVKYKVPHMGGMGAAETITDKIKSDPKYKGYWFKFWGYPALATASSISSSSTGPPTTLHGNPKKGSWPFVLRKPTGDVTGIRPPR